MSLLKLSWRNIITKPLSSCLSILLLSSGIIIILITLLTFKQIEDKFKNNSSNIDLVVGAKGSRLQLVLCNIFHVDQPTGNILYARTKAISKHPFVKMSIPLSLGDSYNSYRIVGTTNEYIDSLYKGDISKGRHWKQPMEVVIGSSINKKLGLNINDEFIGNHGIGESIHSHDEFKYKVVGILKQNNTVLDNLILTSLESVWIVHGGDSHSKKGSFELLSQSEIDSINKEQDHNEHNEHHHHEHHSEKENTYENILDKIDLKDREITSLLVKYSSPRGKFTVPAMANNSEGIMAAEPSIEIQQLIELLLPAISVMKSMALLVMIIAALSMFIAMFSSLKDRKYEIALLRVSGASSRQVFTTIIVEGLLISIIGYGFGLVLSHLGMEIFSVYLSENYHYDFTGWIWLDTSWYLLFGALLIGIISALYPAIVAYKTDISDTLSKK